MSVVKSFFSLAKYNNGLFKSKKQADFLLSLCEKEEDGALVYTDIDKCYDNTYMTYFFCDEEGVYKIVREGYKSGKVRTMWERLSDDEFERVKEEREKEMVEREKLMEVEKWCAKAANIVDSYLINEADRVCNLIVGKSDEDLMKCQAVVKSWRRKIKRLMDEINNRQREIGGTERVWVRDIDPDKIE